MKQGIAGNVTEVEGESAILPITPGQRGMWLYQNANPTNPAFHVPLVLRITGPLDICRLEDAINGLVARHDALRCRFPLWEGEIRPIVRTWMRISVPVDDLRSTRERERHAWVRKEVDRPFDVQGDPLIRCCLAQLEADVHLLVIVLHHLVGDGWSTQILVRELVTLYEQGASHSDPADLPGGEAEAMTVVRPFSEFAQGQAQWLADEEATRPSWEYWMRRLKAAPVDLGLTLDGSRTPREGNPPGAHHECLIPLAVVDRLRAIGRRSGATLFMTLLAGYTALLHRLTGREDVVVGAPSAGRTDLSYARTVGCFINTLALRSNLSGNPSFRHLLERTRTTCLEAYAHQRLPFESIVETLLPDRDRATPPFFQAMLNFQPRHGFGGTRENSGGDNGEVYFQWERLQTLHALTPHPKFDITLYGEERDDGIYLLLVHRADLFHPERMSCLLEQYVYLLEQAAETPSRRLGAFSLRPPGQRRLLPDPEQPLEPRVVTPARGPEPTITGLFAHSAGMSPSAHAVVEGTLALTYADLDRLSDALARRLRGGGLQPGEVVAVYATRSASLAWVLLGILKARGVFAVLDSAYPVAHLRTCVETARARAWVGIGRPTDRPEAALLERYLRRNRRLRLRLSLPRETRQACDEVEQWQGQDGDARSTISVSGEERPTVSGDPAYIAFTSGTTGRPKAVLGSHGPVARFAAWEAARFSLDRACRVAVLSGLSHDPLLRDLFVPFRIGGTAYVPDATTVREPVRLWEWMHRNKIQVAHMTPAHAQLLGHARAMLGGAAVLPHLTQVFFGGDMLTRAHVEQMRGMAPAALIVNYYGTTETPQAVAYHITDTTERGDVRERVPIGQGVDECSLLIQNRYGGIAGVGEVGELCVRSLHLTQGYLNDFRLTARRYVRNPWSAAPDDPMYRTGDLAVYQPNGDVTLLGRADTQLKIRGFRVEPGEVEAVIRQCMGVQECCCVSTGGIGGSPTASGADTRLAVYIVLTGGSGRTNGERLEAIRHQAERVLPEHLRPAFWVELAELPLTPNGKIDVRLLPPVAATTVDPQDEPRSQPEITLAMVWTETLGVKVSRTAHFFRSGGDSLRCLQMIERARARGLAITLQQVMRYPVLADLAIELELAEQKAVARRRRSGRRDETNAPGADIPLTGIQRRFFDTFSASASADILNHYNVTSVLRLTESLDASLLEAAVTELVEQHDALRLRFTSAGGRWTQALAPRGGSAPFAIVSLPGVGPSASQSFAAASAEWQARLDLSGGPVARVCLFKTVGDERDSRLLVTAHHLVADGPALAFLVQDLLAAYRRLRDGASVGEAGPAAATFVRWATGMKRYAASPAGRKTARAWAALPWHRVTPVPLDGQSRSNTSGEQQYFQATLDAHSTAILLNQVLPKLNLSVQDALLTALAKTYTAGTGQEVLLVEVIGHGRTGTVAVRHADYSRTVGWLTTHTPFLIFTPQSPDLCEAALDIRLQWERLPTRGHEFLALRYADDDTVAHALRALPRAQILFKYDGEQSAWSDVNVGAVQEEVFARVHEHFPEDFAAKCVARLADGQLEVVWGFNPRLHRQDTIEKLAYTQIELLRRMTRRAGA